MTDTRRPFVGVDLGGTNMQIGVVDARGRVVARAKRKTRAEDPRAAVIDRIAEGIGEACAEAGLKPRQLGGVGIGAPGAVDPHAGVVLEAVNLRWNDVPLAAILSKRLGVRVELDNDVNVAVFGEHAAGAGRGADDLLGVWVGTGIGGGLILNGRLHYGHFFTAGEIGHTILFPGNPDGTRTLEHNCSRTAIVERLVRLIRANRRSSLPDLVGGDLTDVRSKAVAKAYQDGDRLVTDVLDQAAELLGVSIAGVVTLLSLPRVVMGGGLTEAVGRPWVEKIEASVRRHVFPDRCRKVRVVASALEADAGVLGAALIARERAAGTAPGNAAPGKDRPR